MNKNNHGGARRGAGRKSDNELHELRATMADVWTQDAREAAIHKLASMAEQGDIGAARLLMSYAYGTPPSGDELRTQEAVDDATESLLQKLESQLTPEAWAQVEIALGIETD